MSIITPSRGDLLPLHDPFFGPLQPSAMPPPPPSASPHVAPAPYPPPPILDKMRLEGVTRSNSFDSVSSWRKSIDTTSHHPSAQNTREILALVNTNSTSNASTNMKSTSKSSTRISLANSIPRSAATPDVFESTLPAGQLSSKRASNSAVSGKRPREVTVTSASKRAKVEEDQWRAKWIKMFPTLVFHFEIGTEQGAGKALVNRVQKMGAKVDQFFSTRITHLVVKDSTPTQHLEAMGPPPVKGQAVRESPKNPFLDGTGITDLALKAEALNIKVWSLEKLTHMLSRLAPVESTTNDSLRTLLEEEKIHGTRERDLNAPRPDWYYFKPGSKYLLIEDATAKHRPIMVKEYAHNSKDSPEWPILYEGFLRVSSSTSSTVPVEKIRDRAWSLYVDRQPFEGENPPKAELKRSTSLRAIPGTPKLPDALPYQNASGNSVVLTSNIASTSTASHSPATFGNGMAMFKDRTLAQMNKRVQVLKGNAHLAAVRRQNSNLDLSGLIGRRASTGTCHPSVPAKTLVTQEQLIRMLQQVRAPVSDEPVPIEKRIENREKVDAEHKGREQDTAPGYCENCRIRYNDLSVHIASKKHRRFALEDANFASLDKLLAMLRRPPNPSLVVPSFPPCDAEHGKDSPCGVCDMIDAGLTRDDTDMSEDSDTCPSGTQTGPAGPDLSDDLPEQLDVGDFD